MLHCKCRDLILIQNYFDEDKQQVKSHPFVVFNDDAMNLEGKPYDFIALAVSSYKRKIDEIVDSNKYPDRLNVYVKDGLKKNSFIKCGVLVYFTKKANYSVIGALSEDAWYEMLNKVENLDDNGKLYQNINNL